MARKRKIVSRRKKRWYIAAGLCVLFLALLNFAASQAINPLYFSLLRDDRNSVVSSLKELSSVPHYDYIFNQQQLRLGEDLHDKVFIGDDERKALITKLEQGLQINPKSTKVLYRLSQLYEEEKNPEKAKEYLRRAREIDPSL